LSEVAAAISCARLLAKLTVAPAPATRHDRSTEPIESRRRRARGLAWHCGSQSRQDGDGTWASRRRGGRKGSLPGLREPSEITEIEFARHLALARRARRGGIRPNARRCHWSHHEIGQQAKDRMTSRS